MFESCLRNNKHYFEGVSEIDDTPFFKNISIDTMEQTLIAKTFMGLEAVLAHELTALGAKVETPSKNESPTEEGDADKVGYFDNIKTAIMVQAKKHSGTTDAWAIEQVKAYRSNHQYGEYSTQMWVISTCDMFSERAMKEAESAGVRLIDGKEFCRMILDAGLHNLTI